MIPKDYCFRTIVAKPLNSPTTTIIHLYVFMENKCRIMNLCKFQYNKYMYMVYVLHFFQAISEEKSLEKKKHNCTEIYFSNFQNMLL